MIAELRNAGLDNDEIARRTRIHRSDVYRFSQGDSRALANSFDRIAMLFEQVTGKSMPPEQ
jgi:hypothetical protein